MSSPTPNDQREAAPWDLIVIGGGTAGLLGAKTAATLGARVLLVEAERTGGDCLWTGCVPSKALIAAAAAAAGVRRAAGLGIHTGEVRVDFAKVRAHIAAAIETIAPADSIEALERAGVTVRTGHARFTGHHTLTITPSTAEESRNPGEESLTFRRALIATGAGPQEPPIPGLKDVKSYTSDTIWDLAELPDRLVVIGGGSIGCELGQAFARLGSRVSIIEAATHLLPFEDPAAARLVGTALEADGVRLLVDRSVVEVTSREVVLSSGERIGYDVLLLATGRSPRISDLGLEAAGVKTAATGHVVVDDLLRTTTPTIWAAGDVTGHPQFTHVAGVHGALAASNALLGVRRKVDLSGIPRVTFTQPELAAVGAPTAPLPRGWRLVTWDHARLDRAITDGEVAGFTTLVVGKRGRLVGGTIVGPRAGETIGEVALAVSHHLTVSELAATMHPYPTYNDGVWNSAVADYLRKLDRPLTKSLIGRWLGLRQWSDGRVRRLRSRTTRRDQGQ